MKPSTSDRRWVVVGAGGMLGRELVDLLQGAGADVRPLRRADLDVTDARAVRTALAGADVVVNAAAWTAVDDAEAHEEAAYAVNATGAANVAGGAARTGARLVHVSTDYVFDGRAEVPYAEQAPTAPSSAYGRTKAAGERLVRAATTDHLVVRTAWLYGAHGDCFPRTIARVAADRDRITVVADQVGQPTWTRDLAGLVVRLIEAGAPAGTYHGTSSGRTSWHGFAREVVRSAGLGTAVDPVASDAYPRPARRPAFSVLGHAALRAVGVEPIGPWAERWQVAAPHVLPHGSSRPSR